MSLQGQKLDDMMRKITALLARADHPNTPEPEADSARAMAEKLMLKYRIEESHLAEQGGREADAFRPVNRDVPVCPYASEFMNTYNLIIGIVLHHCGVKATGKLERDENGELQYTVNMVGFESDLRYAEALYQQARIVFAERMEPKPKPGMSDEDNVYRMRNAGMERIRIARLMGWGDTGSATARVTNAYKRACKSRGEDPTLTGRSMSVKAFRESYMEGFTNELMMHLREARLMAQQDVHGGALVLANRAEMVDEEFYRLNPHLRPSDKPSKSKGRRPRPARWTAADEARWRRMNSGAGAAGQAAGKRAAGEVNVNKGNAPGKLG